MPTFKLDDLFVKAQELGASDVHVAQGVPVLFRVNGELTPVSKDPVSSESALQMVKTVLGEKRYKAFTESREEDVSYKVNDTLRLRVNCHYERGEPGLVARIIPQAIPSLADIGITGPIAELCDIQEGLILFTGPTGSGKSTSMAAMINEILHRRATNVITLEDPVEFVFPRDTQGVVRQRQYNEDFLSFAEALKRVLRQDPDVIMVGEMRDLETIAAALTLAETGHLVFATLHTPNTMQTIDRIVDVFPPHQQSQIRSQLSLSLRAIIAQRLVKKSGGGQAAVREVLMNTPAVGNIIRESRTPELATVLQTGTKDGSVSFEAEAKRLAKEGVIDDKTVDEIMTLVHRQKK